MEICSTSGVNSLQAFHHLPGGFTIQAVAARDNDQSRAQPQRAGHGHGRTDAEFSGRIRAGRNHTAFVWFTAHREGLPAKLGVLVFLDCAVKGIQVEVQYGAYHRFYYK
jgi:hypothetical protein